MIAVFFWGMLLGELLMLAACLICRAADVVEDEDDG